MSVEIVTFGCRLNAYESEVMRGHAAALTDTVIVNTCAVTGGGGAAGAAGDPACRARTARTRASWSPAARRRSIPDAWAALPGVDRVLGNAEKLKPESWTPGAPGRRVRHHGGARDGGASGDRVRRPGARVRAGAAGLRSSLHVLHHPVRPRPESQRADRRGRGAGARAGRGGLSGGGADRRRHRLATAATCPGAPRLGQLVRRLLALVPELPRLRLSSLDPAAIDDDLWRLIADEPRLMPHLHLSLQAGSDLILKRMKRRHLRGRCGSAWSRARARCGRASRSAPT